MSSTSTARFPYENAARVFKLGEGDIAVQDDGN
jgi:hypothetical protein